MIGSFHGVYGSGSTNALAYDVYDKETRLSNYWREETYFYDKYDSLWNGNPWANVIIEYLVSFIMGDGFHFEGPGAEDVNAFYKEDNTLEKLGTVIRDQYLFGAGYMNLSYKNNMLFKTRPMSPFAIQITMKKGIRYYSVHAEWTKGTKPVRLSNKYLLVFPFKFRTEDIYPYSVLRPNLDLLEAIYDINMDIPAAVKRLAYSPYVVGLDLDEYTDTIQKEAALKKYEDKMKELQSASTNLVSDKRNEFTAISGSGQMLPVIDLMEPLIGLLLFNAGIPIGYFLQTGANKSLIYEQKSMAARFMSNYRNKLVRNLEQMNEAITDKEVNIVFDDSLEDSLRKKEVMLLEYQAGLVTREYYLDANNIDIEYDTDTYMYDTPASGGGGADASSPSLSQADKGQSDNKDDGEHGGN